MTEPPVDQAAVEHERRLIAAAEEEATQFASWPTAYLPPVDTIPGYTILREIDRGGMGVVYEALQEGTKRNVALKVMLAGPFASEAARVRFDREVELAARLQHPSIVRVLESHLLPAGQRYYAMDYVEGVTLDRHLAASQPDLRAVLDLFGRLCEAVEHAHQHGVVHRDLKPGNVLIDHDGQPHILDFGLAKATDQADSTVTLAAAVSSPGQVLGTLRYLSPEQAAGRPEEVDARTDVYALGVMLFEALTGSMPYDTTGHPSSVIQRILDEPPKRPSSFTRWKDGEAETIVLAALAKERGGRYQSAREFGDDIRRYLAGEPILARPPSTLYRLRKKVSKHQRQIVVAVAVVLIGLSGIRASTWWKERSFERQRAREQAETREALEQQRQNELMSARESALWILECLEEEKVSAVVCRVRAEELTNAFPKLVDARLVRACAQIRIWEQSHDRGARNGLREEIGRLESQPVTDASQPAYNALIGEMYRQLGDAQQAEQHEQLAHSTTSATAESWYFYSLVASGLEEALHDAEKATELDRTHRLAWQRVARLRFWKGDYEGALRAAEELVRLGRDLPAWLSFQGQVLIWLRRYADASQRLTDAIRMAPDCCYNERAVAWLCLQEFEKAESDYSKALEIELTPASPGTWSWSFYKRATPRWMTGQFDKAAEDYGEFITRAGKGTHAYAEARLFLVRKDQARGLQEKGLDTGAHRISEEAYEKLKEARDGTEDTWQRQILDCLAGDLEPSALAANAGADKEKQCEACYYAAERCLLNEDECRARKEDAVAEGWRQKAHKWFDECVKTDLVLDLDVKKYDLTPMNEWHLARWRLGKLTAAPAAATQPVRQSQ